MIRDIEQRIKAHHEDVTSTKRKMPEGPCGRCLQVPDFFKLHDGRERSFRYVVRDMVKVMMTILLRWKCPLCKTYFTDYPPFAVPYKRYIRDDIERFSSRYVEQDRETYRSVVRPEKTATGYEGDTERQFDHTTVWKWIGWLGTREGGLNEIMEWIRYKSPSYGIFRELTPIAPKKYRSQERKKALEQALLLLRARRACLNLFDSPTFPRLETRPLRF